MYSLADQIDHNPGIPLADGKFIPPPRNFKTIGFKSLSRPCATAPTDRLRQLRDPRDSHRDLTVPYDPKGPEPDLPSGFCSKRDWMVSRAHLSTFRTPPPPGSASLSNISSAGKIMFTVFMCTQFDCQSYYLCDNRLLEGRRIPIVVDGFL